MEKKEISSSEKKIVVIFDLDGTLFKTREVVIPSVNHALEDVGLPPLSHDEIITHLGEKVHEFCRNMTRGGTHEQATSFVDRLAYHEFVNIPKLGALYPDVERLLEHLKECGHPLAVCSNGSREYVEYVLRCTGIHHRFHLISAGEENKTKGDMIREILRHFHVSTGLMIGDSSQDMEGAAEADIPSVGVLYGYGDVTGATFKVEDPWEILEVLEKI